MQKAKIPVFFTINESYAPLAAVSIASLIQNASPDYRYEIYIIHDGLSKETTDRLKRLKNDHVRIHLRSMLRSFATVPKTYLLNMSRFTSTIYFRLFLPTMFPEYDKAIYLDSDTIVLGDIAEFYETDLGEKLLGAVADPTMPGVKIFADYAKSILGLDPAQYVNSGVLLMDMKGLREARFSRHYLKMLKKYAFGTIAPDQDYINAILKDHILLLGQEWNVMPVQGPHALAKATQKSAPKLIHYNLFNKPWHYSGVEYEEFFWQYAKDSEFAHDIREVASRYTDRERETDQKNLEAMLERAVEIEKSPDPKFKDVAEVALKKKPRLSLKGIHDYWR